MRIFLLILLMSLMQIQSFASKKQGVVKKSNKGDKVDFVLGNWLGNLKINEKIYKQTPKKPYPYIEEEITFNNAIKEALNKAGNKEYEIITFKNLNHLFQTAKTGLPSEYGKLDEIINEKVLSKIINWLNKEIK